jgi:hypothetical protein
MGRKQKVPQKEIIEALQRSHGLKTGAAEFLGVSFPTIDSYCNKYPKAQAVVDHWHKRRRDRAEYKLDEAIEAGEGWAIMFTLKNARDREYNERVDMNQSGEIIFKVVRDTKPIPDPSENTAS